MSSLSAKHKAICENLFEMETGYVLDFGNNKLQNFVLRSIGIDIYGSPGYEEYCSKANKLRQIFETESDPIVGKLILDLLDHREIIIMRKISVDGEYVDKWTMYVTQIKSVCEKMCSGTSMFSSNEERLTANIIEAQNVLQDIISAAELVCNNRSYNEDTLENPINDYIRDLLKMKGYDEIHDQTRHGDSTNGNDAGEVDILLCKNGKEVSIFEGLILDSVDKNIIKKHIDKAIVNYNTLGTATYIVAYVGAVNYAAFWKRYFEYLEQYEFILEIKKKLSNNVYPNAAIRVADMIVSKSGYDFPVYFVTINMRKA